MRLLRRRNSRRKKNGLKLLCRPSKKSRPNPWPCRRRRGCLSRPKEPARMAWPWFAMSTKRNGPRRRRRPRNRHWPRNSSTKVVRRRTMPSGVTRSCRRHTSWPSRPVTRPSPSEMAEETARLYDVDALDMKAAALGKIFKTAKTVPTAGGGRREGLRVACGGGGQGQIRACRATAEQLAAEARKCRQHRADQVGCGRHKADQGAGGRLPGVPRGPTGAQVQRER